MENRKQENPVCSHCGNAVPTDQLFLVDDNPVCAGCLFKNTAPFPIYPIGYVENPDFPDPDTPPDILRSQTCRIRLFASQKPFCQGLEDETAVTVLFIFHKTGPVRSRTNRRFDGKEVGVYGSHSPHRLSRLGVQTVTLIDVKGTILTVRGLDAIDGTPVVDIKAPARYMD
jgi:tRNA (Thr-GGU) A37 N-methylase